MFQLIKHLRINFHFEYLGGITVDQRKLSFILVFTYIIKLKRGIRG